MSINHRRISLSIAANLFLEVINKISPLLILHHAQKSLGLSDFGWAQYQLAFFETLQPFITYGFPNYAMAYAKDNEPGEMRSLLSHIFALKTINAALVTLFFLIQKGFQLDLTTAGILLLVIFSCVFDAFWVCVVKHKLVAVSLSTGALRVLSLILILTLVRGPEHRGLFVFLSIIPSAIMALVTGSYATKVLSVSRLVWKKLLAIFLQSTPFALFILLVTLLDRLDIFLAEHWFGIEAAGIYSGPAKIVQSLSMVLSSLAMPFFAETRKIDEPQSLYKHIVLSLLCLSVAVAPLIFGLPFVEETLISLLFPKLPASAIGLLSFLCIGLIGNMLLSVFGVQVLLAKGKTKALLLAGLAGLVVTPACIFLTKDSWGLQAVASGIVIGKIAVGLLALWFARTFLSQIPWKPFVKPMLAGALMALVLRGLGSGNFFVNVLVGGAVYSVCLLLGNWRELKDVMARIRS